MKLEPTKPRRWRSRSTAPKVRGRAPTRAEARTALIDAIASMLEAMAQIGRPKP